jgi:hypothetical protein
MSAFRLGLLNRRTRTAGISKYDLALYSYDGNQYAFKTIKKEEFIETVTANSSRSVK